MPISKFRTLLGDHDYVPGAMNLARNLTTAKYTKWVVDRIRDKAQPSEYYGGIEQGQVCVGLLIST